MAENISTRGSASATSFLAHLRDRAMNNNSATRQIMNNFNTDGNGAPGKTYHIKNALPAIDIIGIRLWFQNQTASPITGVKAIISSGTTPSENLNNAGAWAAVTFGGAATVTIPAGSLIAPAAIASDVISIAPLRRSDGGNSTLIYARAFVPVANAAVPTIGNGSGISPTATWNVLQNQEYYAAVNIGDFVASPSTFTVAGEGAPCIVGIEYVTTSSVIDVITFGDSINMGYLSNAPGNSDMVIAALTASTQTRPISIRNMAQGGSNSDTYIALAETIIPIQKPMAAVYGVFTPNDGAPTAATIRAQKAKRSRFLSVCLDYNVIPILSTSVPNTNAGNTASTYSAAVDDLVKALDDDTRSICASGKALLLDRSVIMSNDIIYGVARLWRQGMNFPGDGLHPGDAGYQASAADMVRGAGAVIDYFLKP